MPLATCSVGSPISSWSSSTALPPTWCLRHRLTRASVGSKAAALSVPLLSCPTVGQVAPEGPGPFLRMTATASARVPGGPRSLFISLLWSRAQPQVRAQSVNHLPEADVPATAVPAGCQSGVRSREMRGHLCRFLASRLTRSSWGARGRGRAETHPLHRVVPSLSLIHRQARRHSPSACGLSGTSAVTEQEPRCRDAAGAPGAVLNPQVLTATPKALLLLPLYRWGD